MAESEREREEELGLGGIKFSIPFLYHTGEYGITGTISTKHFFCMLEDIADAS